ncbi:F-box protein [Tripterygium wilfordii]|uniref:F-box protein n=1 Tax=Tripterygium wilfordii TaxID=458696 RepID=A0A7J7C9F9_TRIWF|nr:F-box protein At2g27310-like [Tripterygium wilfordii]KAF5730759.1 F-box protein [Tripterygium wilfordii]
MHTLSKMTITTLSTDIIQAHILTRLDGPSLAALSCASSELRAVSADEELWREICAATWNSIGNSRVRQLISSFPGGHRSFFLDSFPLLDHHQNYPLSDQNHHYYQDRSPGPSDLISAVDIYYNDKIIFSRVQETNTTTRNFLCYPFKVDLQVPKSPISIPIQDRGEIDCLVEHLKEKLSLSWIVIDPIVKRAANLSSGTPVSIDWPCSTAGDVQLFYSTIIADRRLGLESSEFVECRVVITCSGVYEGEMQVDDVSMEIVDFEERGFDGRASLVILQNAMRSGRRKLKKSKRAEEVERYEEFEKRKSEKNEMKPRREKLMYMVSVSLVTCVALWASLFLFLALYLRFQAAKVCTKIRKYCWFNSANTM